MKTNILLLTGLFFVFLVKSQTEGSSNRFDSWDTDGDGRLSYEEFIVPFYELFDTNDDGVIDQDEWNEYGNLLTMTDTSGLAPGGAQEEMRYGAGIEIRDVWNTWETADYNFINKSEFYENVRLVFNNWDLNGDSYLDREEFNRVWPSKGESRDQQPGSMEEDENQFQNEERNEPGLMEDENQ
jgi:Ca2+-binding EF-hand superfamily protein